MPTREPINARNELAIKTSAITAINIVPTLTAILEPCEVPVVIASMVLL